MPNELQDLIPEDWISPDEYIAPELLLDDDHPDADDYVKSLRDIDQKIFAVGKRLKPRHREFARMVRTGLSRKDLAKRFNVTTKSISTWAQREDVIRYVSLMDYHTRKVDGASADHRKGVLWRIAMDNEEKRPNIAVQAIQEMNKMSGTYVTEPGNNGNVVNISINGELLPKTGLDTLPETYEGTYKRLENDTDGS